MNMQPRNSNLTSAMLHRASVKHGTPALSRRPSSRRAFSLVEVLLAIVILGIGVISIAALFPAGIAQQRLSNDDLMGPVVANHAISLIRSKVSQEDFGTFEEFFDEDGAPGGFFTRTVAGDWGWMRPSFFVGTGHTSNAAGVIDIFAHRRVAQVLGWSGANAIPVASEYWNGWPDIAGVPAHRRLLRGIPFNRDKHPRTVQMSGSSNPMPVPPNVTISQRERYYPMGSHLVTDIQDPPQPQYVWDCMFRRYEGRIYVAVFVYRVNAPGGAAAQPYVVQRNQSNPNVPPMPIAIDLTNTQGTNWPTAPAADAWDIIYRENDADPSADDRPLPRVKGFQPADFDPLAEDQSWQAQRQWILDQNNDVHRVLSNRRPNDGEGDRMVIELTRPLKPVRLPYFGGLTESEKYDNANKTDQSMGWASPFNNVLFPSDTSDEYHGNPGLGPRHPDMLFPLFDRGVVTRFWYVPLRMEIPGGAGEYSLTPVYIAVKEL